MTQDPTKRYFVFVTGFNVSDHVCLEYETSGPPGIA